MTPPEDLRELIGEADDDELEGLEHVDELLRTTEAPPEVPPTLWASVNRAARRERPRRRGFRPYRLIAAAAALLAIGFGIGYLVSPSDEAPQFDVFDQVTLTATPAAPQDAEMVIDVLPLDEAGNWRLLAQVSDLPPLDETERYELWLTQGDRTVASCGLFVVDESGNGQNVWLNAPYAFEDFDDWVVVRVGANGEQSAALLAGPVSAPA